MKKYLLGLIALGLMMTPIAGKADTTTLYNCYKSNGWEWESVSTRAIRAAEFGLWGYVGSADQNTKLSNYLCGDMLGFSVASGYQKSLRQSMSAALDYIPVTSLTLRDGHALTMADLGSKVFLTIDPGKDKEEIVMCTTIDSTNLNFETCTRGLAFYATSTVAVAANAKTHNAGAIVVMSNVHYIYDELVDKDTADTIAGLKTFTSIPLIPTATPTTDAQVASKKYVDDTAFAGVTDASKTIKGITEIATGVEASTSALAGSGDTTAPLVVDTSITTSSPYTTGNFVPVTGANAKLSQSFTDYSLSNTWTGLNTFNATTTMATTTIRELYNTTSTISTNLTLKGKDTANLVGGSTTNAGALHTHTNLYNYVSSTNNNLVFGNSAAETDYISTTLPANSLGNNGIARIKIYLTNFQIDGTGSDTFIGKLYLGGTNIATISVTDSNGIVASDGFIEATIINNGVTGAQSGVIQMGATGISGTLAGESFEVLATGSATEDTTGALALRFSFDWDTARVANTITASLGTVEVIPSNP